MIDLTVIIPVYNIPEALLRACLDSLTMQTVKNAEFIVVDDGSREETAALCDSLTMDPRFEVIHQENQGLPGARNTGMRAARGRYLMFVDPDDRIPRADCFQAVLEQADAEKLDLLFFKLDRGGAAPFDVQRKLTREELCLSIITQEEPGDDLVLGSVWSKLFRRDFLRAYELLFDPRLRRSQDRVFMLRLLQCDPRYAISDERGYSFNTQNEGSLSHKYNARTGEYLALVAEACENFCHEAYPGDERFHQAMQVLRTKIFFETCALSHFHPSNPQPLPTRWKSFAVYARQAKEQDTGLSRYAPRKAQRLAGRLVERNHPYLAASVLETYIHSQPLRRKLMDLMKHEG